LAKPLTETHHQTPLSPSMKPKHFLFFPSPNSLRLIAVASVGISTASATDRSWNVATGDFNNGANWNASFVGAWNATGDNAVISNGGTATMATGSATIGQIWVGQNGTGTGIGTLAQTGGAIILSDGLVVGRQGSATGTYTMTGGTINTLRLRIAGGTTTSTGTMSLSGAGTTLTTTETGTNVVAVGSPGTGSMTLSNSAAWNHTGTVVVEIGGTNGVNNGPGGKGTLLVQSSAAVTLGTADLSIGRNASTLGSSTVTVDGGSLTLSGATAAINVGSVQASGATINAGTGILTLNAGTITANRIKVAVNTGAIAASGNGTVNFNGGTAIIGGMAKGGGTATVNFNGSTIQASGANTDFYSGFSTSSLNIQSGGQTFDTNGNAVTITQGMSGVGGFTKSGSGALTLAGASTYNGPTIVNAGTLLVNGSLGAAAVTVNAGTIGGSGVIGGTLTVNGGSLAAGASVESLSSGNLSMASGTTFAYEVANNGSGGADLMAVDGTLSLAGVTLGLDPASLAALASGSFAVNDRITLFSYKGTAITGGLTDGSNPYADDTTYSFGPNQWLFNYDDSSAGNNFGPDATAGGQNLFVTMTLVPEPSAALLGCLGALFLLRRRRL
jgi:fibronectin-binding autotransporter adhesin